MLFKEGPTYIGETTRRELLSIALDRLPYQSKMESRFRHRETGETKDHLDLRVDSREDYVVEESLTITTYWKIVGT